MEYPVLRGLMCVCVHGSLYAPTEGERERERAGRGKEREFLLLYKEG